MGGSQPEPRNGVSGSLISLKETEHGAAEEGVQGHERILSAEMSEQFYVEHWPPVSLGENTPRELFTAGVPSCPTHIPARDDHRPVAAQGLPSLGLRLSAFFTLTTASVSVLPLQPQ